jgi:hypothetical protein
VLKVFLNSSKYSSSKMGTSIFARSLKTSSIPCGSFQKAEVTGYVSSILTITNTATLQSLDTIFHRFNIGSSVMIIICLNMDSSVYLLIYILLSSNYKIQHCEESGIYNFFTCICNHFFHLRLTEIAQST